MIEVGDVVKIDLTPPLNVCDVVGTDGYPVHAKVLRIPADTGGHWEFELWASSDIAIPASVVIAQKVRAV